MSRSAKDLYPKNYEEYKQSEKYRLINSLQTVSLPAKAKCKELANYKCEICGAEGLDAHHIIPQDKGGSEEQSNLICLCRKCHQQVHKGVYTIDPDTRKVSIGVSVVPMEDDNKPQYIKDFEKQLNITVYKDRNNRYYSFINGVKTKFTVGEIKATIGYKPRRYGEMSAEKRQSLKDRKLLAEYKRIAKEENNIKVWHFLCKAIADWDTYNDETKELVFKVIEKRFK